MNPKKKSRRYRVSVSIHALDLAISRFTHSLDYAHCKGFISNGACIMTVPNLDTDEFLKALKQIYTQRTIVVTKH